MRRVLRRWVRIFPVALILGVVFIFLLESFVLQSAYVQEFVRKTSEKELSKAFRREVKVGHVSGNLLHQAIVTNIVMANADTIQNGKLFVVPRLVINYNIFEFFRTKDIIKAASTIHLYEVQATVIRDSKDQWNVLTFLPPGAPGEEPPFHGVLYLHHAFATVTDHLSWEANRPQKFEFGIADLDGSMDFHRPSRSKINLRFRLRPSDPWASLSGRLNILNGQYDLNFNIPVLLAHQWGDYLFPFRDYRFSDGRLAISGRLISKDPIPKRDIPFNYELAVRGQGLTFKLPFFDVPITKLNADLIMNNRSIIFQHLEGDLDEIPFSGAGEMKTSVGQIDLDLSSSGFDASRLMTRLPALKTWRLSGESSATVRISGPLQHLKFEGSARAEELKISGIPFSKTFLQFQYDRNVFSMTVPNSQVYDGNLTGAVSIDCSPGPLVNGRPQILGALQGKFVAIGVQADRIRRQFSLPVSGTADLSLALSGNLSAVQASILAASKQFLCSGQKINRADLQLSLTNGGLYFPAFSCQLNDGESVVSGFGKIEKGQADLSFSGADVPIRFSSNHLGHANFDLRLTPILNAQFWAQPLRHLRGDLSVEGHHFILFGQAFSKSNMSVSIHDDEMMIRKFSGEEKSTRVTLSGELYRFLPRQISFNGHEINLGNPLIQKYLPPDLKPFSGSLTGALTITGREGLGIKPHAAGVAGFFQDLKVSTEASVSDGKWHGQAFDRLAISGNWDGNRYVISRAELAYLRSRILISGQIFHNQKIDLQVLNGTNLYAADLQAILSQYLPVKGQFIPRGTIKGEFKKPEVDLDIQAYRPEFYGAPFDEINGKVSWHPAALTFNNLVLQVGTGNVKLNGSVDLGPFRTQKKMMLKDFVYSVSADLSNLDLALLSDRIERVIQSFRPVVSPSGHTQADGVFSLSDPAFSFSPVMLYQARTVSDSAQFFQSVKSTFQEKFRFQGRSSDLFSGTVSGSLSIKQNHDPFPQIETKLTFTASRLMVLNSAMTSLRIFPGVGGYNTEVRVEKGQFGGQPFSEMTMDGALDLRGDLRINSSKIRYRDVTYTNPVLGWLPLSGYWDPSRRHLNMSVSVNLQKNGLSLLALFSPYLETIQNNAEVALRISGPLAHPLFNAPSILFRDARIQLSTLSPFQTPFLIPSASISIVNNRIVIPSMNVLWQGEDTRDMQSRKPVENHIGIHGDVDIRHVSFLAPDYVDFNFNLSVADGVFQIHFPSLYDGQAKVQGLAIQGPYRIPFSPAAKRNIEETLSTDRELGPSISGFVFLSNGQLGVPKFGPKTSRPSFLFNLQGSVKESVGISGAMFSGSNGGLLANIDLNLKPTTTPLLILGSLNAPIIRNTVYVEDGEIQVLAKTFVVLKPEQQQKFAEGNPDHFFDNSIRFGNVYDGARRSLLPQVRMIAGTVNEPVPDSSAVSPNVTAIKKNPKVLVVGVNGPVNQLSSISIAQYDAKDPNEQYDLTDNLMSRWTIIFEKSSVFHTGESASDNGAALQAILGALFPDTYSEILSDFAAKSFGSEKTMAFLNQVGEQQINKLVHRNLRPFERQLARDLGVTDIRLNYNFGQAILGGTSDVLGAKKYDTAQNLVGVDIVKQIFDSTYLRLRTNLDFFNHRDETPGQGLSFDEIEMSYYLTRSFSLNAAQVKDETTTYHPRYSLRLTHEF